MLNNKLKVIIVEKGLTQKEVAEKININVNTLYNWCNGRSTEQIYNIYKLCKFLDVDIRDIFKE